MSGKQGGKNECGKQPEDKEEDLKHVARIASRKTPFACAADIGSGSAGY